MEEEKPSKQINISNRILCSPHNLPVRSMCDKYYCSWHLMVAKHFECLSVAKWTRSMQITSGILTKMVLHYVLIRCAFIMGCECSRQMCFATGNVCNVPLWLIKNRKFEAAFSYKWLAPSIGRLVWSKCGSMDPARWMVAFLISGCYYYNEFEWLFKATRTATRPLTHLQTQSYEHSRIGFDHFYAKSLCTILTEYMYRQ